MKICGKCKKKKSVLDFNKNSTKVDGLQTLCRECNKSYLKEHYKSNTKYYKEKAKKRKEQIREEFKEYKQTLSCEKCGESRWYVLDFHHTDPSNKDKSIAQMNSEGISTHLVLEEIKKCIVLCRNCHAELHFLENEI